MATKKTVRKKTYPYEQRTLKNLPGEHWKSVLDYEAYYLVSSHGRVKSLDRSIEFDIPGKHTVSFTKPGRILSQGVAKRWNSLSKEYIPRLTVVLCVNQKMKTISVSRLVYQAFNGPLPAESESLVVTYKDGDNYNNRATNLLLTDQSGSGKMAYARGRSVHLAEYITKKSIRQGAKNRSKPITQYDRGGNRVQVYPSVTAAAKKTGSYPVNIFSAATGRLLHAAGFLWRYGIGPSTIDLTDYKKRLDTKRKNRLKTAKQVTQYSLAGTRIAVYDSIAEAAGATGGSKAPISQAVAGHSLSSGGFLWRLGFGPIHISPKKYIDSQKNRNQSFCKKVVQCTLTGKKLKIYSSVNGAALAVGCQPDTISNALTGKLNSAKGYTWKYFES